MDYTEDLSARVLLKNILSTEPPRTPVTRSSVPVATFPVAGSSIFCPIFCNVSRANSSTFVRRTRSSMKNASAETPQDILRRSLKQNMREGISRTGLSPASKRRTTSVVLRKANTPASSSMLFDEGDTPRHILMNILRTEPVKSPVIHEEAAPVEPQMSLADSSDVTHSNIGLSELDLPDLTFGNAASVAKRLTRKRPRHIANVSTLERRLREGEGENEEEDLSREDLSLSLSNVTSLTLKTPFVNVQTEKKGLQRRVTQRQKITQEGFGDAVNKMLLDYGASSMMQGEADFSESAQDEALNYKLEFSNDISHSKTSDAPACNVSVLGIQDQSTIAASQMHLSGIAMGPQSQLDEAAGEVVQVSGSQEEENTAHSDAELKTSEEEVDDRQEEEGDGVESQTEEDAAAPSEEEEGALLDSQAEEDVAASSQEEDDMKEKEGAPVDSQAEEDPAASSQEEDAATPSEEEDNMEEEDGGAVDSQADEDPAASSQDEDAVTPSEEEDNMEEEEGVLLVDSQADEDPAASSQEEDAATPSEEEDNMEEEDGGAVDSQADEDPAASSQDEDAVTPSEEEDNMEEEEGVLLVDSQADEDPAASSQEEDAATPSEEEDNMEEDEEAAVATRTEESASVEEEEEHATAARPQSEEEDTAEDENDGSQHEERGSKYDVERVNVQADASKGALVMPVEEADVMEPGCQRGSGIKNRTHRLSDSHNPIKLDEVHLKSNKYPNSDPALQLEVSNGQSYSNHLEDVDPPEQEEWEEEDDGEEEEIPMKTPAFVRERRNFQVDDPASPTILKPQASNTSDCVPLPKPKRVRKPRSATVKKDGLPKNYLMGVFRHFAKTKVSADIYPVLNEIMDKFFDRMVDDLETFAAHAKRKTIEVEDVELLLRRQGHVNDKVPVEVLIEKYLRMDQRKLLIPIATSGNVVIPKMRR
uniref:centromere protein T isoform X2 n=1 Tax=Doryrhamphus excisus TaxID=161450 RepID=UPI0025ADDD6C|nr:centromere protein T isoform X2 [Doryrhamphus excisus]